MGGRDTFGLGLTEEVSLEGGGDHVGVEKEGSIATAVLSGGGGGCSYPNFSHSSSLQTFSVETGYKVQGGPSGCTLHLVDIKTKVPSQNSLFILKCNSQFDVNIT